MKGLSISSQTVIFAVAAAITLYTIISGTNILQNNVVEQRMMHYRAEELSTTVEVLSNFENYGQVERRFGREYNFTFEDDGSGGENLTLKKAKGEPVRAEVPIYTSSRIQNQQFGGRTICIEKTRGYTGSDVVVSSGSC